MNKTLQHQGRTVFYRSAGAGKPIVLIHGFAEDGEVWHYQVDQLERKYRVIVPDLPGSGQSQLAEDVRIEALAETVKAILDAEKIVDTVLIGHSMGGYVTLAFAEKYPEMLKGFGLFHSTAYADTEQKIENRRKNIGFIENHGVHEFLKQSVPALFGDSFKKKNPNAVRDLIERYRHFDPVALSRYYEAMIARPDRTHVLKEFSKPVLFIIGKQDNAVPFRDSMELCHLPALAYIHILDESGHMGLWEEVEEGNQALENFLDDLE